MKKFVLTVVLLALCAGPSFGADRLGLFADTNGNACNITVPVSTQFSIYVLHTTTDGTTASEFSVSNPANATMLSIGNDLGSGSFLQIGDPYAGVSVAYTACLTGTFVVYNMKYLALAPQANCIYVTLGPDPTNNKLLVADCGYIEIPTAGAQAILNPQPSCDCDVPTQQTTWGKVKSLYR